MKFQPKRFVVEVKRGTSRASFASPDASSDRFSSAEAVLFGAARKVEPDKKQLAVARGEASQGRVLPSLVEPPPPVIEDPPPPVRRGRKPGSKNKPKLHPATPALAVGLDLPAERPRRGRKLGSKNKPKMPLPTAFHTDDGHHDGIAAAMRSYGFADDGTVWQRASEPAAVEAPREPRPEPGPPLTPPSEVAGAEVAEGPVLSRPRLRERSAILKRYVLNIEPRPGQPGSLRVRRTARTPR